MVIPACTQDSAALITASATVVLVVVTAVYAGLTWQLVKSARESGQSAEAITTGITKLVDSIANQATLIQSQYELSFRQYNDVIAQTNTRGREARHTAKVFLLGLRDLLNALDTTEVQNIHPVRDLILWRDNNFATVFNALEVGRPVQPAFNAVLSEQLNILISLGRPQHPNEVLRLTPPQLTKWANAQNEALEAIAFILSVIDLMEEKYYPQEKPSTSSSESVTINVDGVAE